MSTHLTAAGFGVGLGLAALLAVVQPAGARDPAPAPGTAIGRPTLSATYHTFTLANGLEVLVLPDKRGTVVSHILNYRVGAADEQAGETGLSHFFEHLMFKATRNMASGHYSRTIERFGGVHNASAHQDITSYYARVDRRYLETVMRMEADRMTNLLIDEDEVTREREVIKEERRMRVDNSPGGRFHERLMSITYLNHPYRRPVIGWMHEIAALDRDGVRAFYEKYYGPQNAVLIVAGNVTVDEVKALAERIYGPIPKRGIRNRQVRPVEPEQIAARRISREDPLVTSAQLSRLYLVPAISADNLREVAAISLLMQVVGDGIKSRIYQELVVKQRIATSAGAGASHGLKDSASISFWVTAAEGHSQEAIEKALDALIADVVAKGITAEELDEAKAEARASLVYERASQYGRANMYGWNLAQGRPPELIDRLNAIDPLVTLEDVKAAAAKMLRKERSTTGWLLPQAPQQTAAAGTPSLPPAIPASSR